MFFKSNAYSLHEIYINIILLHLCLLSIWYNEYSVKKEEKKKLIINSYLHTLYIFIKIDSIPSIILIDLLLSNLIICLNKHKIDVLYWEEEIPKLKSFSR